MSLELDEIRIRLGLNTFHRAPTVTPPRAASPVRLSEPSSPPSAPQLSDALARAGARPRELEEPYRALLWALAGIATLVAAFHALIAGAFGRGSAGWADLAHGILTWPHPLVQPVIAGGAAVVIIGYAAVTGGLRNTAPADENALLGAAVAALVGAVPLVVVVAAFVVAWALIIAVIFAVVLGILALLFNN